MSDKEKNYKREWYLKNKERILEKCKLYYKENYESLKERREENKEHLNEKCKNWREENKEYVKQYKKDYNKENAEHIKKQRKEYKSNYKERRNILLKEKKENDKLFNLSCRIRASISKSFKQSGFKKTSKTCIILDCTFEEFKNHIESQFESWMNWNNHGLYNGEFNFGWDLDHIIPISSAKTEEDVIKLNHHTNFQPLCSHTNRNIKKDNY